MFPEDDEQPVQLRLFAGRQPRQDHVHLFPVNGVHSFDQPSPRGRQADLLGTQIGRGTGTLDQSGTFQTINNAVPLGGRMSSRSLMSVGRRPGQPSGRARQRVRKAPHCEPLMPKRAKYGCMTRSTSPIVRINSRNVLSLGRARAAGTLVLVVVDMEQCLDYLAS